MEEKLPKGASILTRILKFFSLEHQDLGSPLGLYLKRSGFYRYIGEDGTEVTDEPWEPSPQPTPRKLTREEIQEKIRSRSGEKGKVVPINRGTRNVSKEKKKK